MAELKTKETTESVEKFLNKVPDEQRRKDCFQVLEILKATTKAEPAMGEPASSALAAICTSTRAGANSSGFLWASLRENKI